MNRAYSLFTLHLIKYTIINNTQAITTVKPQSGMIKEIVYILSHSPVLFLFTLVILPSYRPSLQLSLLPVPCSTGIFFFFFLRFHLQVLTQGLSPSVAYLQTYVYNSPVLNMCWNFTFKTFSRCTNDCSRYITQEYQLQMLQSQYINLSLSLTLTRQKLQARVPLTPQLSDLPIQRLHAFQKCPNFTTECLPSSVTDVLENTVYFLLP